MARGRKKLFNEETLKYLRDNPDQLTQAEMALKYATSIQTVKRAVLGKGAYRNDEVAQELSN